MQELNFYNLKEYDLNIALDEVFLEEIKQIKKMGYKTFMQISYAREKNIDDFIILDLETTGLHPKHDEIIEIGAIKFIDNVPVESFRGLVKPTEEITQEITAINGITNEDVANAPSIVEVLPHFIKFIGKHTLIAHNVSFDLDFLQQNLYVNGFKKITNNVLDTLILSKDYIRNSNNRRLYSYSLKTLKEELCLHYDSHRALEDCKACASVYLKCKNIMNTTVDSKIIANYNKIEPIPDEQVFNSEKNIEIKNQNINSENIGTTDMKKTRTNDEILKTKNIITLTNESGKIKVCSTGFSWTSLLLMYFAPLFRLDFKNFFIQAVIITFLSSNTATLFISVLAYFYFAFTYNKTYIKDLIKKGYVISQ